MILDRSSSVAVEFALISVLFFLPLLLGSADFISIIAAQAQANAGLQALYYFALTTPDSAANLTEATTVISKIDQISLFTLSMPTTIEVNGSSLNNPSYTYVCYTKASSSPDFSAPSAVDGCDVASQKTIIFVNYRVTVAVALPFPLPGLHSPYTLSSQGAIQVLSQ